ncbi:MAG: 30S ribosomal protein S18 [Epsilonproteobacteria bacterium]|jgi:small subunit ribosomal protein S18|nr:30S ribosomal protein S18 [Campylobacterota bacterium]NPA88747.1 30S ribosomal protein S18 [Campylobacterota bacterium]
MARRKYGRKKCKYCEEKVEYIGYKDIELIKYSLSERYKIMPRRLTGTCKKHQDMVQKAIKRARQVALIPYVVDRHRVIENPFDEIKPLKSK